MHSAQADSVILHFARRLRDKGGWCGETHLQEAAHFLQQLTGVPIPGHFRLWKHGPHSFDLKDLIYELIGYGFMSVSLNPAPYGPTLVTTERAERLVSSQAQTVEQHRNGIEFVTDQFADKGVAALEKLGTALLVTRELPDASAQVRS